MAEKNDLSEREIEILKLVATGASNKEIAQRLYISSNTVKVHLRNIFAKIGAESRTEAAMYAVGIGLITDQTSPNDGLITLANSSATLEFQSQVVEPQQTMTTEIEKPTQQRSFKINWVGWLIIVLTILSISALTFWFVSDRTQESQVITVSQEVDRWFYTAPMTVARGGLAVATLENQLYAIGGTTESGISVANERYDPTIKIWEALPDKPTPTSDLSAAVIGGKIYLPGGRLADNAVSAILEIFDPRSNQWKKGAPLPEGRSAYGLAAFEGKLYLFGGWNGKNYVDTVYEYSPAQDQWIEKTSLPGARGFLAAAEVGGKIYVIGGFDGKNALRSMQIYSPELDNGVDDPWGEKALLPESRYQMGAIGLADNLYILGGKGAVDGRLNALNYNPQMDQWTEFETPIDTSWLNPGVAALGNYLYAAGGLLDGKPTAQNLAYQAIYTILLPVVR